ncbi:MAG: hypothetical protein QGI45_15185, partial [Myxococcota bacterium]|nr:hypothetical protein [Myxococcota bacterium]
TQDECGQWGGEGLMNPSAWDAAACYGCLEEFGACLAANDLSYESTQGALWGTCWEMGNQVSVNHCDMLAEYTGSGDPIEDACTSIGEDYALDNCGVCDDDPNNDCTQDECGQWGGEGLMNPSAWDAAACYGCLEEFGACLAANDLSYESTQDALWGTCWVMGNQVSVNHCDMLAEYAGSGENSNPNPR